MEINNASRVWEQLDCSMEYRSNSVDTPEGNFRGHSMGGFNSRMKNEGPEGSSETGAGVAC